MNTKEIIDNCLKSIQEVDVTNPVIMTRQEVLDLVNYAYQTEMGERLNYQKEYQYDGSDSAHTITDGKASLPSDFLQMVRVYDGDPSEVYPLIQIFDIANKVSDDDDMSQYFIPSETTIWFFGTTPTNTVRLYYRATPTVLTDDTSSEPVYLRKKFHLQAFTTYIKMHYADRMDNYNDFIAKKAEWLDILDEIEGRQSDTGRADNAPVTIVNTTGW